MARKISPAVAKSRAHLAALHRGVRAGERPESDLIDAQRDHVAAKLSDLIERALAEAPPLTVEQRVGLAELFQPARESAHRQAVVAERIAELDGGGDHAA